MSQSGSMLQYVVFSFVGLFYCGAMLLLDGSRTGLAGVTLVAGLFALALFVGVSALSLFRARTGAAVGTVCSAVLVIWSVTTAFATESVLSMRSGLLALPSFVALGTAIYGVRATDSRMKSPRWQRIGFALVPVIVFQAFLFWQVTQLR